MSVKIYTVFISVMTPYNLACGYRNFGKAYCLYLQAAC